MAFPHQLLICTGIKVLIVLLTIVVLILLDPTYVTAYISINYEIVMIYLISALTLLYCVVSIVMYAIMTRRGAEDRPMTNCALTEVIFSGAGMIGWMLIIGIGGNIAQRTIIETGEFFGWIGALAGIIVACFLGICALFCLNIVNEKILMPGRHSKYNAGYYQGR